MIKFLWTSFFNVRKSSWIPSQGDEGVYRTRTDQNLTVFRLVAFRWEFGNDTAPCREATSDQHHYARLLRESPSNDVPKHNKSHPASRTGVYMSTECLRIYPMFGGPQTSFRTRIMYAEVQTTFWWQLKSLKPLLREIPLPALRSVEVILVIN